MSQRKYINNSSNKTTQDAEFGKLQDTCDGITFTNGLFIVVGSALLYKVADYYFNELRRSDQMGHIFTIVGMLACIGGIAYGIYGLLKRVRFYEYGCVYRNQRMAYDDIISISSKRVISVSVRHISAHTYYYINNKNTNSILTLDSDDFRNLNTVMSRVFSQIDVHDEK